MRYLIGLCVELYVRPGKRVPLDLVARICAYTGHCDPRTTHHTSLPIIHGNECLTLINVNVFRSCELLDSIDWSNDTAVLVA